MIAKPQPTQYLKYMESDKKNKQAFNIGNSTVSTYASIDDIFGVFTKEMLDVFENHFLNFCQPPNKTEFLVGRGETSFQEFLDSDEVRSQYPNTVEPGEYGWAPKEDVNKWLAIYENQESLYNGPNLYRYDLNIYEVVKSLLMIDKRDAQ